jgi:hypothetical protein
VQQWEGLIAVNYASALGSANMKIEEVQSMTKKQRVASHTHIKGLGLKVIIWGFFLVLVWMLAVFVGICLIESLGIEW